MTWQEDAEVVRDALGSDFVYDRASPLSALARLTAALERLEVEAESGSVSARMLIASEQRVRELESTAYLLDFVKKIQAAEQRVKDAFQALDELEEAGSDPAPLRVVRFALGDEK